MNYKQDYTLYLVTDRNILKNRDLLTCIEKAIHGGVTLVQLREKNISSLEFFDLAQQVKELTDRCQIPLIINDRVDIALAVDAAGVHLGQEDLPTTTARKLLGSEKLLGISAATLEEALSAERSGADYIGVGALFPTTTKSNTRKVTPDELRNIKQRVNIPVVAIGGINQTNLQQIAHTGIDGIAVVSAILGKSDIENSARKLLELLQQ